MRVQALGLEKELVLQLVRELHDLVFMDGHSGGPMASIGNTLPADGTVFAMRPSVSGVGESNGDTDLRLPPFALS